MSLHLSSSNIVVGYQLLRGFTGGFVIERLSSPFPLFVLCTLGM